MVYLPNLLSDLVLSCVATHHVTAEEKELNGIRQTVPLLLQNQIVYPTTHSHWDSCSQIVQAVLLYYVGDKLLSLNKTPIVPCVTAFNEYVWSGFGGVSHSRACLHCA